MDKYIEVRYQLKKSVKGLDCYRIKTVKMYTVDIGEKINTVEEDYI